MLATPIEIKNSGERRLCESENSAPKSETGAKTRSRDVVDDIRRRREASREPREGRLGWEEKRNLFATSVLRGDSRSESSNKRDSPNGTMKTQIVADVSIHSHVLISHYIRTHAKSHAAYVWTEIERCSLESHHQASSTHHATSACSTAASASPKRTLPTPFRSHRHPS